MIYYQNEMRLRCAVPLSLFKESKKIDESVLLAYLNDTLDNNYSSTRGYIVKLLELVQINSTIFSDSRLDSIIVDAIYKCISFDLTLNEVVLGVIVDLPIRNNKSYIVAQVGPVQVEIHSHLFPDSSYRYNAAKEQFYSITSKKSIQKSDEIRLKIVEKTERIHRKTGKVVPFFTGSLKGLMLGKI